MTRSNEVATNRNHLPEFDQWAAAMRLEADIATESDFDPAVILQNILAADSFEKSVEAQSSSLVSGKSIAGVIHTIYSFELRKSDEKYTANERSLGVWAAVHAADENGNEFTYGVGAANVLAILWQARQFGKLPGKFQIISRDTKNGELLSLMPVKTAVQG
jgi:hypothetical protein